MVACCVHFMYSLIIIDVFYFVLETSIPNINYAGLVAFNAAANTIPSIFNTLFLLHLYLT